MADPIIGQISVGDGATFTPAVDSDGVISWSNNKNLPNPASVDIPQAVMDRYQLAPVASPAFTGVVTAEDITASGTITGNLTGNADTATNAANATNDSLGNNIANTYLPAVVGAVVAFAGSTSPAGWLLCDGSAVSRTTYAALFSVIGTTYGDGNGSTTFNLPNLVNRMMVGTGGLYALGSTGGEASHALTEAELASHTHTFTGTAVNSGNQSADHTHSRGTMEIGGTMTDLLGGGSLAATGAFSLSKSAANFNATSGNRSYGWFTFKASNNWTGSTSGVSANHTHSVTASGTNSSTGSGTAHNNMPPYVAINYIIKY